MELSKTFQQIKSYANNRALPLIPFCAKNVSTLKEPSVFYESLLNNTRNAKKRVALSALYIGTGAREQALVQELCDNLKQNAKLNVNITLDANRAERVDQQGNSSVSILQSVLAYDSVSFNLVNTNSSTNIIHRILSKFERWNELSSTYHSKLLVFDNDVIITGANLSGIYFDKRQDRYISIKSSKFLSDYIYGFLNEISNSLLPLDRVIDSHNKNYVSSTEYTEEDDFSDSYIIPLFQHGPSGVTSCDDFLMFLDSILPSHTQVHMSSGYLNPQLRLRLTSVLCPSEEANGFYRGAGILKFVPRLYTALIQKYCHVNPACSICLYKKPGWSYHAKGIWFDGLDDLTIHMVGSSNFNWRSSTRDFELQFVVLTRNRYLKDILEEDRQRLWADSKPLRQTDFEGLNPIYNMVASIIKSLL